MELIAVKDSERDDLFEMAVEYWAEIMPHARVVADSLQMEKYFESEFTGSNRLFFWGASHGARVGFISYEVYGEKRSARIANIYVQGSFRHRHYGTRMVRSVLRRLDELGIEQIDLNVRRDNPIALAFWQSLGFGIAGHKLRMYRDPEKGIAFVGALSSDFADGDVT